MGDFTELLKALEAAEENTPAVAPVAEDGEDDDAIAAAAADGDDDGDVEDNEDANGKGKKVAKPMMAKSFAFTDSEGNEQEAVDATELIKSLMAKQDNTESVLAKALTAVTSTVNKQTELIKSLNARIDVLSGQGRGRKTMLTVAEKPNVGDTNLLAKSEAGITPADLMAKANMAFDSGKISGRDLNLLSVSLRGGHPIDPGLLTKVAGA